MYTSSDIARQILTHARNQGHYINNQTLQAILYFVQAEFLVTEDKPCFPEPILNWFSGPTVPSVYLEYRAYGNRCIPSLAIKRPECYIPGRHGRMINDVTEECLKHQNLAEITKNQAPYLNTQKNKEIPLTEIQNFFEKKGD